MKQHIGITIDNDIIEGIRALNINISKTIEDCLANFLNNYKSDVDAIDKKLIENQIHKLIEKMSKDSSELNSLKQKLEFVEEKMKVNEQKALELKKEEITKMNTCVICSKEILNAITIKRVGKNTVCSDCFYSPDREIKRKVVKLAFVDEK